MLPGTNKEEQTRTIFSHKHVYAQTAPSSPAPLLRFRFLEKGKIDNIVQKNVFDVLLVVEEETV